MNTNLKKPENKESIYFKSGKRGIIETKGEQNEGERLTADSEGGLGERQGNLSDIQKEYERRVGIERQVFSEDPDAPDDFREACNEDGHIPNKIGKSLSQGKNIFIFDTATVIKN